MTATNDTRRRRRLSAFCCLALGLFFLTNPITRFCVGGATSTGQIAAIGFVAPLHMALMVGSLLGITQLLRHRADRAGLIGATLVLFGWTVSTRIMVIGQLDALLTKGVPGVPANALQKIFQHAPLVFGSIFPIGLLFPIGLIVLGLTMAIARPIHRGAGVLMAMSGVLFPLGRIGGYEWAVVSSDLALAATFALTGWQIYTRPELWEGAAAVLVDVRAEPAHA